MTNEQAKKEVIKKAYGEYWDLVKDHITSWGALSYESVDKIFGGSIEDGFYGMEISTIWKNDYEGYYCPAEIYGIENNNGWIRIEPYGSNLPEKDGEYRCFTLQRNLYDFSFIKNVTEEWWMQRISHYKPIEPELLPIY